MSYVGGEMEQPLKLEEQATERRRYYDPALETLVNPDYGPQIQAILKQVKAGSNIEQAHSQIMQMLAETAATDTMTKLNNAEGCRIKLSRLMEYSKDHNIPLTVVYMDVDDFKKINDRISHDIGDEVIRVMAEAIKQTTRSDTDIRARLSEEKKKEPHVDEEEPQARMGGDEFALVLPTASAEQAVKVVDRFRARFSSLLELRVPHYRAIFGSPMTVRAGIAEYNPAFDETPSDLINRAETAMRESRLAGKGGTKIATPNQELPK